MPSAEKPLLQTKLYILPPQLNLISRVHPLERVNAGLLSGKLMLVPAPAGFDKTIPRPQITFTF